MAVFFSRRAHEFKAVSYADLAAYQTGLATETAAGWHPVATTNRAPAVGEETLIVTYRRVVVS